MYITWYGQSCFKLQSGEKVILIDPHSPRQAGLRGPNFKATILVLTNPEDKKLAEKDLKKECFLIDGPGEYEIKDIFIYGISLFDKNKRLTIYQIEFDGIKFGILGEINTLLTDGQLEKLNGIDVLFIPVGGKNVIGAEKAIEMINQISPKIVIPCNYKVKGIKVALEPAQKFLREMGIKKRESLEKLSLRKKDLSEEETRIVILEPKI